MKKILVTIMFIKIPLILLLLLPFKSKLLNQTNIVTNWLLIYIFILFISLILAESMWL